MVHTPPTFNKYVKRNVGCSELNEVSYQIDNATFDILCNITFSFQQVLQIMYTTNFAGCISACVSWNAKVNAECVGVSWTSSTYGPLGVNGGSLCGLLWDMTGNGTQSSLTDSARLHNETSGLFTVL